MVSEFRNIRPGNLSEADRQEALSYLDGQVKRGESPFIHELRKTKEELELIALASDIVGDELSEIGIKSEAIKPRTVHFYNWQDARMRELKSDKNYKKAKKATRRRLKNTQSFQTGEYSPIRNDISIYVSRDAGKLVLLLDLISKYLHINQMDEVEQLSTLSDVGHELVHRSQFRSFRAKKSGVPTTWLDKLLRRGPEVSVHVYRTGYDTNIVKKQTNETGLTKEIFYKHFQGFNEAVTERTILEMLLNQKEKIIKSLGVSEEDFDHFVSRSMGDAYVMQQFILDAIIHRVSSVAKTSKDKVWDTIKRGQFTGEMMHLRAIEKVYGPGSLRVLASMNGRFKDALSLRDYLDYFRNNDLHERNKIALSLLVDDEKKAYTKRRNEAGD